MVESLDLVLSTTKSPTYRIVARFVSTLSRILFRPVVEGVEHIPLTGPVLIAPIHRSNVDFVFTLFISPRKVFFMAKDGVFRVPLLGKLLTPLGAFPVRRNSVDRESLRLAEEVLRRGQALVLFPEGTRKVGPLVGELHNGAMFIAARTGATVVPVGIAGSDRAMPVGAKMPRFARVHIVVGRPIEPPVAHGRINRSLVAEKTEELRRELQAVYARSMSRDR